MRPEPTPPAGSRRSSRPGARPRGPRTPARPRATSQQPISPILGNKWNWLILRLSHLFPATHGRRSDAPFGARQSKVGASNGSAFWLALPHRYLWRHLLGLLTSPARENLRPNIATNENVADGRIRQPADHMGRYIDMSPRLGRSSPPVRLVLGVVAMLTLAACGNGTAGSGSVSAHAE